MKKFIKTGLLFTALLLVFLVMGVQVINAGYCEDLCTPREDSSCTARGETCPGFESMTPIDPIPPDL